MFNNNFKTRHTIFLDFYLYFHIYFLGLTTFSDNTHGFPRNEGFFQECQLKKRKSCADIVQKGQKLAFMARNMFMQI